MKIKIMPGYLVLDDINASGGVHVQRWEVKREKVGDGMRREGGSLKTVDHEALVAEADQIANRARNLRRKYGMQTPIGTICSAVQLASLEVEMAEIATQAADYNQRARDADCDRRVRVGIVPMEIQIDNEKAIEVIGRTIRETLGDLIARIHDGDPVKLGTLLRTRAKNLDALAIGMQKISIRDAISCAKNAQRELATAKKESKVAKPDVEPIESAIGYFTDLDLDAIGGDTLSLAA